jgi:hypothetical protein
VTAVSLPPPGFPPPPAPGGTQPNRGLDWVSLSSLICSATLCLAPIGAMLGVVGLMRTRSGRRDGRWAAVTGLVVGLVGTGAAIAAVVGLAAVFSNIAYEDTLRAGDCVQVTHAFGEVDLWVTDCSEPHDAEIAATGVYDERTARQGAELRSVDFCTVVGGLDPEDFAPTYALDHSSDSWSEAHPEAGDYWVCFIESADGQKTRGSVLGQEDMFGA